MLVKLLTGSVSPQLIGLAGTLLLISRGFLDSQKSTAADQRDTGRDSVGCWAQRHLEPRCAKSGMKDVRFETIQACWKARQCD